MLPRRLPPVLPTPLFAKLFKLGKRCWQGQHHSGSPRHAFAHCGGFAPAAPRRARALVSVPFWGLPLSWPLGIIGLVGRYPTNYHNPPHSHPQAELLQFAADFGDRTFQYLSPIRDYPQFPVVIPVLRVG